MTDLVKGLEEARRLHGERYDMSWRECLAAGFGYRYDAAWRKAYELIMACEIDYPFDRGHSRSQGARA